MKNDVRVDNEQSTTCIVQELDEYRERLCNTDVSLPN